MLLLIFAALADEPETVYKEKTEIDFEAVDIEGHIKKPHGILSMERAMAHFSPLIQVRESFLNEMNDSIEQIK